MMLYYTTNKCYSNLVEDNIARTVHFSVFFTCELVFLSCSENQLVT